MNNGLTKNLTRIRKYFPRVKTIVDADGPVFITVTEDDQDRGHVLEETECALAKACVRQLRLTGALIGLSTSYLIRGTTAIRYKTGNAIDREIVSFDRNAGFTSGTYRLAPFGPKNRLGARPELPMGRGEKNPRRGPNHITARVRGRV